MKILVVSDFHLGRGKFKEDGDINVLEDFDEDERFIEFLDYYSLGTYYLSDVHVVLNGDILNLIQLDVDGEYTHLLGAKETVDMLKGIVDGHKEFFDSLRKFLARPNKKLTYVIGNHDFAMVFPEAKAYLKEVVGEDFNIVESFRLNDVHIEHGHRFEPINTSPRSKYFVPGPEGRPIINLPWGSLFCLYVLPKLKIHRPYIDNIRPLSLYARWTITHDFRFFCYAFYTTFKWLIRTQFSPYPKFNKNFRISLKEFSKFSMHPSYINFAKRIFTRYKDIKVVVFGHSHISEWRRLKGGKYYFNTGTWNHVPSLDKSQHKNINALTYVTIDMDMKQQRAQNVFLSTWRGKWRPYIEEVKTNII